MQDKIKEIQEQTTSCLVSLSGGLDSTTLLHLAVEALGKENVVAVSYFYKQRHSVELDHAKFTAKKLGVRHKLIDISFLGDIVSGVSAMVEGNVLTPTLEDTLGDPQPVTYVPYRNLILTSIGLAIAETEGADSVMLGLEQIDNYAYWDASSNFVTALQHVADLNRKHNCKFLAPFVNMNKTEEIKLGTQLGVDYSRTNTCYNPNDAGAACGVCPSCKERISAFKKAGLVDPVEYQVTVEW